MPSKTSFFNPMIFGKNVRRFWPLWGLYLAAWCLMPLIIVTNGRYLDRLDFRESLLTVAMIGGPVGGAIVAVLMAMLVWGFLYNTRSAHGMACLPVKREALFLSEMLSGIVPLLAANLVVAVLTALAGLSARALDFGAVAEWFAIVSLTLLFFYGFATLCAQLTGHIVVLPLVYGVLNFVFVGAEFLLRAVFSNFVYGMYETELEPETMVTRFFSPLIGYFTSMDLDYTRAPETGEKLAVRFTGWNTVIVYALVGVVMLAAALLLFRRRKIETASEVVAVKALRPVFRWCMAFGCALLLSVLLYAIFLTSGRYHRDAAFVWMLVFLALGALLGWFIAEMLMKKSFRVFRAKQWAGFGVCCAVIVAMMLGMRLDLFGYEKRVPEAEQIESVRIQANGQTAWLSSPEDIELARQLHREIIADKSWNNSYGGYVYDRDGEAAGWIQCRINYRLKNGAGISRSYQLRYELGPRGWGDLKTDSRGELAALNALLNTPGAIANRKATSFPFTRENIYYGSVSTVLSAAQCAALGERESPEEYILCDILGWAAESARSMDPELRSSMLAQGIYDRALNANEVYVAAVGRDSADATWDLGYESMIDLLARNLDRVDYDRVFFEYSFSFEPSEVWELYGSCVLPDLADGTLGRVWAVSDQAYYDTVYRARIEVGARQPQTNGMSANDVPATAMPIDTLGYINSSFYTVPTVDSFRTNLWMKAHGVPLYTVGQFDADGNSYWYMNY